jgi:preprotein translocase subunit SecD
MSKTKKIFTNWKVLLMLLFLIFAIVSIRPEPFNDGAIIKSVEKNSSAAIAGIENPKPGLLPLSKEKILSINNKPVDTIQDYYDYTTGLKPDVSLAIETNKNTYKLKTKALTETITLNETELKTIEETIQVNETIDGKTETVNKTINKTIRAPKTITNIIGTEDIGLRIGDAPLTNLRKGLDLQGGTRVLLQPAEKISDETFSTLIDNLKERLNVYGLSDILVTEVRDKPKLLGEGNKYILVEIAGATEEEVQDLLSKQGKFEAKVGTASVFKGGQDITYVCRTAECSGIDPNRGCGKLGDGGWACGFMFSISLSPEAAQRQADATQPLQVITKDQGKYLSEELILYLDDQEVDRLNIAADLKGRATTEIAISGSGSGATNQDALNNALKDMKRLQTILITGSLPVKLNIVKIDNISPALGIKFLENAMLIGFLALLAVATVVYIKYRKLRIAIPMMITSTVEIILVLGFAALVGWNLDLAALAGIIVAVGTGVDQLIIIADETLKKETAEEYTNYRWADKLKRAFFVIIAAYFTTLVAMIPLMFAGAGLLKGFALTTLVAESLGVFIARPAYAAIVQILLEDNE